MQSIEYPRTHARTYILDTSVDIYTNTYLHTYTILHRPFIDPTYDPKTRTFTADVVWWPARADGDRLWRYTMGFSADFEYVQCSAVQYL